MNHQFTTCLFTVRRPNMSQRYKVRILFEKSRFGNKATVPLARGQLHLMTTNHQFKTWVITLHHVNCKRSEPLVLVSVMSVTQTHRNGT
jgi:hypothetical protein